MKRYFGFAALVLGFLLMAGISNGYAQDCPGCTDPECTGDVVAWLAAHPTISNAIVWEDPTGIIRYAQWSAAMKTDLLNYFQIAWTGGSFGLTNPPPNLIPLVEPLPSDDWRPYTAISKAYAWPLYLSYVANSLAVEMKHRVPWSLAGYSNENLAVLFDSRTMFTWMNDFGEAGFPGISGYSFGYPCTTIVGSMHYCPNTYAVPAPADYTFNFLRDHAMITSGRFGAIAKLVNWCRQNMIHFSRTQYSLYCQFHYIGFPPVKTVIEGVPNCYNGDPNDIVHYTWGCGGTTSFLTAVLRSINIPTTSHEDKCPGHALPSFPTEGLYLSHGDDPYGLRGAGLKDIPIEELFIDQATFDAWFGANVSSEWCSNVGRRVSDLMIQYLPSQLLNMYCSDIAAGKSHQDGQVYNSYFTNYTVAELEAMHLWERLEAKNCGACAQRPVANGTSCADNDLCNGTETCQNGVCTAGTPPANGTSCADNDLCNGTETCQNGVCTAGTPLVCNDNNPCTTDTCNTATGACVFTNVEKPDLVISSVSGPATGVVGSNITFSIFVENQGNADIIGTPITIAVYLSTDSMITSTDTQIAEVTLPGFLPAGSGNGSSYSATIPAGMASGSYYIGAIADPYNQIAESNESNNARTGNTITVSSADTIPPTGTIIINSGATYTTNATVTLTLSATDASGVSQMKFSNDNATWSTPEAYATSKTWTLSAGNGTKTVYVKYKDTPGNWSAATISDTIILDTVGPVSSITAPDYSTDTSANVTFTVQWSATDTGSGVSTYDVDYRLWSSSTYTSFVANSAAISKAFTGTAGQTYYFRVRARDRAGNVGSFSADKSVVVPFDQSSATYSGTWSTVSDTNLYLGSARYATASTASMTYNFTSAREVWLIFTRRNNAGYAQVYIGSTLMATIDFYQASTTYRQKVRITTYATPTAGTLKVVVTGTKRAASSGTRVEIDGIGIKK